MPEVKRLIHAHSTARLHIAAVDFLEAQRGPVAVLAPSRAAADDLIREACEAGHGFLGVQRMTLTQLAASLAAPRLAELGLKPASRLAIEALTTRVIATAALESGIPYFAPVAATPGMGPAVSATLTELRLDGVDAAELALGGAPARDLAALLTAFEEDRAKEGLADLPVVYDLASRVMDEGTVEHESLGIPLLILDVPLASGAQREFLRRVAATGPPSRSPG